MNISCVIIDDEPKACQLLVTLLKDIQDVEVLKYFTDPHEARLSVMKLRPDLIFLDINMPGLSGLDLIGSLKMARFPPEVVFVTAHDSYILEAIRKDAFDYLLKPLNINELNEVICRFKGKQRRQVTPMDLCYGKLQFNTLHGFFLIELSDIVYVKADGNYSIVHLKDGSNKVITMNLGQIEERLTGFRFFRMDRSLVINLQSLIFVNRKDRYCTVDYNGSTVDFSIKRSRIKQLVEMF